MDSIQADAAAPVIRLSLRERSELGSNRRIRAGSSTPLEAMPRGAYTKLPRDVYTKRPIVESSVSIDVRRWHRDGLLRSGQKFPWSWSRRGDPAGSMDVVTTSDAVVLHFCWRGSEKEKWKRGAAARFAQVDDVPPRRRPSLVPVPGGCRG
jgi:hypothetical protein